MIGIILLDLHGYQRLFFGGMAIVLLAALSILFVKRKSEDKLFAQKFLYKAI